MDEKKVIKRNKNLIKQKLVDLKTASGCKDCGETNHIVLDFDHLRDKKYNISRMVHDGFSWAAIKKEIAKCEVVCANCHRIRTHNRLTDQIA
jgi:transcription elongation factor Elf1